MVNTPLSTPKRKHADFFTDHVPSLNTTTAFFTFDPHTPVKDGSASPRTNVAIRFRGLALGPGGGGGVDDSSSPEPRALGRNQLNGGSRKRVRLPDVDMPDFQTRSSQATGVRFDDAVAALDLASRADFQQQQPKPLTGQKKAPSQSPRQQSPKAAVKFAIDTAVIEQSETIATSPRTATSPRGRPRTSPPPLSDRAGSANETSSNSASVLDRHMVTDPLRASLTWHDDEITIYDPDDSDDDGTGINGIGFKPTPAIAYARTVKRKQQLAEYRKREEREARAKRSQRRRGSPVPGLVELKGTVERRRVRFMESATELISF